MSQYERGGPAPDKTESIEKSAERIRHLEDTVERQSKQIADLETDLRKLRNEVRLAVNSFNLRRG